MTHAASVVRPMSTEEVLGNHLRAAGVGVDAVLQDFTEESVLITHDATYRGLVEIRRFYTDLFDSLPTDFFDGMKMSRRRSSARWPSFSGSGNRSSPMRPTRS